MDEHIGVLAGKAIRPGPGGGLVLDRRRPCLVLSTPPPGRGPPTGLADRRAGPEASMDARRWHRLAAWARAGTRPWTSGAGVRGEVVGTGVMTLSLPPVVEVVAPSLPERPSRLRHPRRGRVDGRAGRRDRRGRRPTPPPSPPSPSVARPRPDRPAPVGRRPAPRRPSFDPLGLDGHSMPVADFLPGPPSAPRQSAGRPAPPRRVRHPLGRRPPERPPWPRLTGGDRGGSRSSDGFPDPDPTGHRLLPQPG